MLLFQELRCVTTVTPTFLPHSLIEKQLCNGETYKKYEKRAFAVQISSLCVSKLEVFTQLPPACNENS